MGEAQVDGGLCLCCTKHGGSSWGNVFDGIDEFLNKFFLGTVRELGFEVVGGGFAQRFLITTCTDDSAGL